MKNLHRADHELFIFVREVMTGLAHGYLPLKSVSPMPKKRCRYYGECDYSSGKIWIRVRKVGPDGRWATQPDYPYQIMDTVAHELAHLRYRRHDHQWFGLYVHILSELASTGAFKAIRKMFKERKNT